MWCVIRASHVALVIKKPSANAGDLRDAGWIPASGRSLGRWHDNPLQYSSCLFIDRGACQPTVHRVTKRQTWLKQLRMQVCVINSQRRGIIILQCRNECITKLSTEVWEFSFQKSILGAIMHRPHISFDSYHSDFCFHAFMVKLFSISLFHHISIFSLILF